MKVAFMAIAVVLHVISGLLLVRTIFWFPGNSLAGATSLYDASIYAVAGSMALIATALALIATALVGRNTRKD